MKRRGATMSKVLFIACRLPYPLDDGWKIRTFNLLKGLVVKGHSVDLVTFVSDCENEIPNALRQLCRDIYSVDRKRGYAVIDLLKGLIAKKPFSVFNYGNKEMKELIESLINLNYDFIQIEDIVMAEYLPLKSEAFKILDMHNIESKLLIRYAEQEKNALKKIYAYMTAYKLHNYEIQTSRLFDNIYVCSESDRQHLLKYIEKNKISVIPNGVDCTYYQSNDRIRTENRLVFVGSMDYHANMSGISYFVKEIFPRVVASFPKVVLYIVGKNPPVHITRLAGPRIVVTGAVEDVRPFLSSAALVIV